MADQLIVLLPVATAWVAAGVVADGLPRLERARALRRRTGWLFALTLSGVVLTAAVLAVGLQSAGRTAVDQAADGLALAAVPALVVAACTVRRVRRLWAGAGAFAAAPETPAPHGLRAAAAHPLIGLPIQVTALAVLPAVISAAGVDLLAAPAVAGPAVTVGGLGVIAIGVRHALRHNRLAERALPPAAPAPGPVQPPATPLPAQPPAAPVSARATGPLHV
ncbi:hypothetical protein GA0074695_0348 [Micromonospora viridifaciens]|uniref:Uncharacterized protein n=1 Tax=Micromonospora viridifaciens TaxID=1881 RepID=A0A1C4UBT9_MICVI|nr:hypothetical protein [Micromonospora viridifaciens]SCE69153.1 hypothetical protein GA0074695_0348 [Micromonospora viridifaciens]